MYTYVCTYVYPYVQAIEGTYHYMDVHTQCYMCGSHRCTSPTGGQKYTPLSEYLYLSTLSTSGV